MHSYIYMCVGVHALCIAKYIHRHEPRRFMWVYADRARTVCVYLHPQRIRVMSNADVCESWSASIRRLIRCGDP